MILGMQHMTISVSHFSGHSNRLWQTLDIGLFKLLKPPGFCTGSCKGSLLLPAEHEPGKSGVATPIFHCKRKAYLRMKPAETRQSQKTEKIWDLMTF